MVALARLATTGKLLLAFCGIYFLYIVITLILPAESIDFVTSSKPFRALNAFKSPKVVNCDEYPGGKGCEKKFSDFSEEEKEEEESRSRTTSTTSAEVDMEKSQERRVAKQWIPGDTEVRLWIDLPNGEFVKRLCFQEYSNFLILMRCDPKLNSQKFILRPEIDVTSRSFALVLPSGRCMVPSTQKAKGRAIYGTSDCSSGRWNWTMEGEMRWEGGVPWQQEPVSCGQHYAPSCAECPKDDSGKYLGEHMCHGECHWINGTCKEKKPIPVYEGCPMCLTGIKENMEMKLEKCEWVNEQQLVEVGGYYTLLQKQQLKPRDNAEWQTRQDKARSELKRITKMKVTKALEEIKEDEMMSKLEEKDKKNRRAVVFYMDKGKSGKQQLNWWLKAWKFSGLDEPQEAFDIVVMVHPDMAPQISSFCKLITPEFSPMFNGSGECFYKPYIGIAHRDPSYDKYMNSQECLIGPGTEFLGNYKVLLRADMDTFPTPRFRGFWPEGVLVDKHYSTNFNLRSIKYALKKVACEAGMEHKGLYNPGSTWYGDARRLRQMAKLVVALNKFGRASLFGPGTVCRCAECTDISPGCAWSKGIYPGVLLLYMQELAVNRVLTQKEWDELPSSLFDQGVSSTTTSVCGPALLHCYQHQELFSKLAFGVNKYVNFDMSNLDLTVVSGYAAYMALTSNGQGNHGEAALQAFNEKTSGLSLWQWCDKSKSKS